MDQLQIMSDHIEALKRERDAARAEVDSWRESSDAGWAKFDECRDDLKAARAEVARLRERVRGDAADTDPKPDAVAQARERFTEAAITEQEARRALGAAMGLPDDRVTDDELRELSAAMDAADERLNDAYMALLATEQAEREGGA